MTDNFGRVRPVQPDLSAWPRSITAIDLMRQRRWSVETFGPDSRTVGVTNHIRKELDEVLEDPYDLSEWVDIMILAVDGAWRAGHSPQAIIDGYLEKMEVNYRRSWPDWQGKSEDEPIEHVDPEEEGGDGFNGYNA